MITPQDIVNLLRLRLPAVTSLFGTNLVIESASLSGTEVEIEVTGHGLTVGTKLIVQGGIFHNPITTFDVMANGFTRITTNVPHDVIKPSQADDIDKIVIELQGAPWNGEHTIADVTSKDTIDILTPIGVTVSPVATGRIIEPRTRGIQGTHEITDVPGVDEIIFDVGPVGLELPQGVVTDLFISLGQRVLGATSLTRADDLYTNQLPDEPYLFVMMADAIMSKDRTTHHDGTGDFANQNLQKMTLLQNFDTLVIIPTASTDSSGFEAQNLAYNEIYTALMQVLLGETLPDVTTAINSVIISNGHGPVRELNSAYYSHTYSWQLPSTVTRDTGGNFQESVVLQKIQAQWNINGDTEANLQSTNLLPG